MSPHEAARIALQHHIAGDLDAAEPYYEQALLLQPTHQDALWQYGTLLLQKGRFTAAISSLEDSVERHGDNAHAWSNLGLAYSKVGRIDEAGAAHSRAATLAPRDVSVIGNYGSWLISVGRYDDAIDVFGVAIKNDSNNPDCHINIAVAFNRSGRHTDAIRHYTIALSLDSRSVEAWFGIGNAYRGLHDSAAAVASYTCALKIAPADNRTRVNLGATLADLGRFDEADEQYRAVLTSDPSNTEALCNRAYHILRRGDYANGWAEYENRHRSKVRRSRVRPYTGPAKRWTGESIDGKRLLLVAEQGLGDQIQFVRFARDLRNAGATIDVWCDEPLVQLFGQIDGIAQAFGSVPRDDHDFWCPIMSVPYLLGEGFDPFSAPFPYITPTRNAASQWTTFFSQNYKSRPKIGIVWAGNRRFENDINRSIALASLEPILDSIDATWIALQKEWRDEDRSSIPDRHALIDLSGQMKNFDDTAGLIEHLDLVISVDTAVAHLAGAMGKPVWILLPANSDWRWQLERDDSPWYPTARLFRQNALGNWRTVLAEVAATLRQMRHESAR